MAFFLSVPFIHAASPGNSVFSFLKIDPAARPAGMGSTNSLITSQSSLLNPALLPWIRAKEISLQHLQYLADSNYSLVSYVHPLSWNSALGAAAGYLSMGNLTRTVADASLDGFSEKGSFGFSDTLLSLGYGRRLTPEFSYGLSVKAVQETIDAASSSGAMFSAGGFYYPRRQRYHVGFGVFNVGPQVRGFDLPSGGYLSIGKYVEPALFLAGEAVGYLDQTAELRGGLEYNVHDTLFFRAGYRYPLRDTRLGEAPNVDVTGGIGIAAGQYTVDYAWLPYGDLGTTHRLSLTSRFGRKMPKELPGILPREMY
ncbi:MAG: PorV/PorQ family protein [Endomicrobiales bacterium]